MKYKKKKNVKNVHDGERRLVWSSSCHFCWVPALHGHVTHGCRSRVTYTGGAQPVPAGRFLQLRTPNELQLEIRKTMP